MERKRNAQQGQNERRAKTLPSGLGFHKMLGALEVKAIARIAAEHRSEWKPIHAAVIDCLFAHRNRRTGNCWPRRKDVAAHCGVSERTVDRIAAQLADWGAIERQQPRALSSQKFRPAQYTFLFTLPPEPDLSVPVPVPVPVEDHGVKVVNPAVNKPEPCDKNGGAVRQNQGEPCDILGTAIRNISSKDLKLQEQSQKGAPLDFLLSKSKANPQPLNPDCPDCHGNGWKIVEVPGKGQRAQRCECSPVAHLVSLGMTQEEAVAQVRYARQVETEKARLVDLDANANADAIGNRRENGRRENGRYTQTDFDERDWRKLQKEIALIRESRVGSAEADESQQEALFRRACARAGISARRGNELYERMLA